MKRLLTTFLCLLAWATVAHAQLDGPPGVQKPPTAANIQTLLNTLGTSQGSVVFRGPSLWTATQNPVLGIPGSALGTLGFAGSTSGTVTVEAQAIAGNWTFKWPTIPGTAGQLLSTDGTGTTSWVTGSGGGGGGTVTSISAGCASSISGAPITTVGAIVSEEIIDLQTGANFPIPNSDCGGLVNLSNAAPQAPTIAQASAGGNFIAGWFADVCNIGAGTQTLTPATSTIGGAATLVLSSGQCARIISDGANYQFIASGNLSRAIGVGITGVVGGTSPNCLNNQAGAVGSVLCARLDLPDQVVTGGGLITTLGLTTGNITVDCGSRQQQSITNGGAFTILAPTNDSNCIIAVLNNATAGAITFSGFTVGTNTGDALTTTNGSRFWIWIARIAGISSYSIKALQ